MRSYDVCQCGAPLELREQATPEPTGTEVLLRVVAAGVCHSDLHFWEGTYDLGGGKVLKLTDRGMTLPLTMGHESLGGHGAIVLDIDEKKREAARQAGALATIDANAPDALQQITEEAKGGVWGMIDFVGSASTVKLGIDCLTKGGKLIVVGLFGGEIAISTPYIPMKAMTLQ